MSICVVYTKNPKLMVEFMEGMGLTFVEEQHGEGKPVHWACEKDGNVFEIYPVLPGLNERVIFL